MIRLIALKHPSMFTILLICCVLMQSCAFTPVKKQIKDDEVESLYLEANTAYRNQDYKKTISLLDPLAKRGYAKAQYTLGYMYYNGQGVSRDREVALRWTQLAASKGYPKAVQALKRHYQAQRETLAVSDALMEKSEKNPIINPVQETVEQKPAIAKSVNIEQHKPEAPQSAENPMTLTFEPQVISDVSSKSMIPPAISLQTASTNRTDQTRETAINNTTANHEQWILAQPPTNYTLQLIAGDNEEKIKLFIIEHDLYDKAVYFRSYKRKNPWYSVIFGSFSTLKDTEQVVNQLPEDLRKPVPWVRDFTTIRKLMNMKKAN